MNCPETAREKWLLSQLGEANTSFEQLTNIPTCNSNRRDHWNRFALSVGQHIDNYTVPQYGDYPDDQIEGFSIDDFRTNLMRYTNRIGKGVRGKEESLRDCFKIAHYAQMLFRRLSKEE